MAARVLVSTDGLSREQWLEYRCMGIGGSDSAVVCGLNKYKSPIELWLEKTGQTPSQEQSEAAYWGTQLESLVKSEFTKRTGIPVILVPQILQSREYPFMIANLDGVCRCPVHGKCIVEIKTANAFKAGEWENDSAPKEYIMQLHHYLTVTGYNGAYIAVLIGGNTFKWTFVKRDEEIISMLIRMESDFWNRVTLGIAPEMNGSDSCAKYLSNRYPVSTPMSKIQLSDSAVALINQYNAAREKLERITIQKQEAENRLKEMLGNNAIGFVGNNTITWINVAKEGFDTKAFKIDQPSIYSKYVSNTSYRRFAIKTADRASDSKENQDELQRKAG